MTDGYIIATNMPIVKSLYRLSVVTYLSEREQLSIFVVMLPNSQLILDCWIGTENRWTGWTMLLGTDLSRMEKQEHEFGSFVLGSRNNGNTMDELDARLEGFEPTTLGSEDEE